MGRASEAPLPPSGISACLFDLDGVLTQTAKVHAQAWKQMFDAFLAEGAKSTGKPFRPFQLPEDYTAYVDGKLRVGRSCQELTAMSVIHSDA